MDNTLIRPWIRSMNIDDFIGYKGTKCTLFVAPKRVV